MKSYVFKQKTVIVDIHIFFSFFLIFMHQENLRHILACLKKEWGQSAAILIKQAWAKEGFFMATKELFSLGIKPIFPRKPDKIKLNVRRSYRRSISVLTSLRVSDVNIPNCSELKVSIHVTSLQRSKEQLFVENILGGERYRNKKKTN